MKKGKIFGKRQIVTAALVLCLAAAVWLNMKYSSFDSPADSASSDMALGDGQYLNSSSTIGEAISTSAGVSYISTARTERNSKRNDAVEEFKTIVNNSAADETAKNEALKGLSAIADRIEKEAAIETVIKAKGFEEALAVISDESVMIIVPSENLLTSETLQIQDAVKSQLDISLEKIKIIPVK